MAAGRRSSSEKSSEATRSGEDAPGNEAVPGRQAAPGEAAEAGHLAGAGRRAAALEAVRASAATRARYSLSTARRTKAAVEERQLVAAIEASLASHASWRGTADSDGRYTREVTRLACMQAEAATGACTGAPASHVAIPWWRRRGKRPRRAGDWTCHCPLHVAFSCAFSRPLSPDEGEHQESTRRLDVSTFDQLRIEWAVSVSGGPDFRLPVACRRSGCRVA